MSKQDLNSVKSVVLEKITLKYIDNNLGILINHLNHLLVCVCFTYIPLVPSGSLRSQISFELSWVKICHVFTEIFTQT